MREGRAKGETAGGKIAWAAVCVGQMTLEIPSTTDSTIVHTASIVAQDNVN